MKATPFSVQCYTTPFYLKYLNPPNVRYCVLEDTSGGALACLERALDDISSEPTNDLTGKIVRAMGRSVYGIGVVLPAAVTGMIYHGAQAIAKRDRELLDVAVFDLAITVLMGVQIGVAATIIASSIATLPISASVITVIGTSILLGAFSRMRISLCNPYAFPTINYHKSEQYLGLKLRVMFGIVDKNFMPVPELGDVDLVTEAQSNGYLKLEQIQERACAAQSKIFEDLKVLKGENFLPNGTTFPNAIPFIQASLGCNHILYKKALHLKKLSYALGYLKADLWYINWVNQRKFG